MWIFLIAAELVILLCLILRRIFTFDLKPLWTRKPTQFCLIISFLLWLNRWCSFVSNSFSLGHLTSLRPMTCHKVQKVRFLWYSANFEIFWFIFLSVNWLHMWRSSTFLIFSPGTAVKPWCTFDWKINLKKLGYIVRAGLVQVGTPPSSDIQPATSLLLPPVTRNDKIIATWRYW